MTILNHKPAISDVNSQDTSRHAARRHVNNTPDLTFCSWLVGGSSFSSDSDVGGSWLSATYLFALSSEESLFIMDAFVSPRRGVSKVSERVCESSSRVEHL